MSAKREVPRVTVSVRFEPHEISLIDEARGSVPRAEWIATMSLLQARGVCLENISPPSIKVVDNLDAK